MNWHVLASLALFSIVKCIEVPSWETLQVMFHEKLEDIYQNGKSEVHKKIEAGKPFKFYLSTESGTYKAVQEGRTTLPKWLTFDPKKKILQGIPLEADVQKGLKIQFLRTDSKIEKVKKTLTLDIVTTNEKFMCKDSVTTASIIFHSDLDLMTPHTQLKFLRHLSNQFNDIKLHDLHIEHGNTMDGNGLINSQIRMAGPGDRNIKGNKPGFTVSWKLRCGVDISGHQDISTLRSHSEKENFSKFGQPVLGWFVSTNKLNRLRRAIPLGATPGATPSSVQSTPTLIPPESTVTKSRIKVSVTPSKTTPMTKTSAIPTTMKTTTLTTKISTTTEEPTTTTSTTTTLTHVPTTETTTTTKSTTTKFVNQPPRIGINDPFNTIDAQENTPQIYEVPRNLFIDDESLTIELQYFKSESYSKKIPSWITYTEVNKMGKLYLFPSDQHYGKHKFKLIATDPYHLSEIHSFEIMVHRNSVSYKFKFNVTINKNYSIYEMDLVKKVDLLNSLRIAVKAKKLSDLKDVKLSRGSVVVSWGVDYLKNATCNDVQLQEYLRRIDINALQKGMHDYEIISSGSVTKWDDECVLIYNDPVSEGGSIWERILIPVIVIIAVLLIIALILCCVYRRKRKYETAEEQDETYLNHKKPVIFLEEYEEKPDFFSLQPLILPNEKPPVSGTPDFPESSTTASTESENTPLAPGSPKDRNGFNAPPPYSAR